MPILTKKILNYLSSDPTPTEVARFLTMLEMVEPNPLAATINFINDDGTIFEIARFGLKNKDPFLDHNSIWANLEPFKHLRKNQLAVIDSERVLQQAKDHELEIEPEEWLKCLLLIPVTKKEVPIGALALFFDKKLGQVPALQIDYESLQSLFVLAFRTPQFEMAINKNMSADLPVLTDLETRYLEWIARGFSNKQIANQTQQALPTVKARVSKLLKQFEARNRKDLIDKAKSFLK
jgi:DNA-binding CsgD family transcriptional regulator